MLYVLIGEDAPDTLSLRQSVRGEHLARLQQLQEEGRLLVAGPLPAIDALDPGPAGFAGSLIIAEFESLSAAEQWFADDAYVRSGVYQHTRVHPFKKVLP